jgi:beta-glucosidase
MREAAVAGALLALATGGAAPAQEAALVTQAKDTTGTPAERAAAMLAEMTQAEKLTLLEGYFGTGRGTFTAPAEAREGSAGYVPGIPRLGIPPQWVTVAGIGVASQGAAKT